MKATNAIEVTEPWEQLWLEGMEVTRVIFDQTPYTKVVLEEIEGCPFIHVEVKKWSPSVMKYLQALWEGLYTQLWLEGYSHLFAYNVNVKFTEMVSGEKWTHAGNASTPGNDPVELYYLEIKEPKWVSSQAS